MSKVKFMIIEDFVKKYPDVKLEDIANIQQWLISQPHLPKITDLEVALFLHASYFSVEAAKVRLDNFYTCRTKMDFIFSSRDIAGEDIKELNDALVHLALPTTTPEGYRVNLIKVMDPDKFNIRLFHKRSNFVCELDLLETGPDVNGIFVIDMNGSRLSHLMQINPTDTKQLLYYAQHAFNGRLSDIHFINPVPFMSQVLSSIKPFLTPDRREQIKVHEKFEDIHQYVPAEIFPSDYKGGKAGTIKELNDKYYNYLLEHREYFLEEERTRRVNEKLRPVKSPLDEVFGAEGNFKKLDID